MSDTPTSPTQSWPLNLALRVETACTRFEDAWKAAASGGSRPRIEDFLADFAATESSTALAELVALDIAYRSVQGEQPTVADYQARFPEQTAQIQLAFEELKSLLPPTSLPPTRDGSPGTMSFPAGTARVPPETWPAIPGYEFLNILGRGGMGVVFQARQLRPNRIVALKMMRDGTLAGPDHMARFRLEAEVIAKLHHPNIVQIYEVGELDRQPYFSLEFMEGGSLAHRLEGTPQQPRAAAELTGTLAGAVDAAHRQGIVHRDLKPSNVLLTAEGLPKITDFGLAKLTAVATEPVGESMPTQTGVVLGTPSYMAPEQARGDQQRIGPATDVYALGAILYEQLTGRPPFKAATPVQTVHEVIHEEPVPPRRLQRSIPRDLETICLKCLHKEPERRYESAAALAQDLHRFLAGEPINARPASAWERAHKWARRRPAAAALVALGTAAVVGFLAVTLWFNAKLQRDIASARAEVKKAMLRADVDQLRLDAATALADKQTTEARKLLRNAFLKIAKEADLEELCVEVAAELALADSAVQQEQDKALADKKYRKFVNARDDALFRAGFLLLGDPAPADCAATQEAAREALNQFGLRPEDVKPDNIANLNLGPAYTAEQQAEIRAGCQELRLLLADDAVPAEKQHPATALDYCLLGIEHLRTGETALAIKAFDEALNNQPGYFWAQYLLAVAHLRTDDTRAPVRMANARTALLHLSACRIKHASPLVYLVSGVAHGQLENYKSAEDDFDKALKSHPDEGTKYGIYVNRGAMRVQRHDLADGIADLKTAIGLQKERAAAYVNLAQAYEEIGRVAEAQGAPFQASFLAPALAVAQRLPWLQLAAAELDKALEYEKRTAALYRFRARLYRELNDPKAALRALDQAIRLFRPSVAEDFAEKGRILFDLRQYEKARDAFQAAIALRATSPATYLGLGYTLWALAEEESDDARKWKLFESAVEALGRYLRSPEGVRAASRVYGVRGLLQLKLRAYADALSDFNIALETANVEWYRARGWAYLGLNDIDNAARDFEQALRLKPRDYHAMNALAQIRVKKAQDERTIDQGVAQAQQALEWEKEKRTPERILETARVSAQALHRDVLLDRPRWVRETHENQAILLLTEAVGSIPPQARREFWRTKVMRDPDLKPIHRSRGFKELEEDLSHLPRVEG